MISRRKALQWACGTALLNVLPTTARASGVRVHTGPAFGSAWRLLLPDTNEAVQARTRLEAIVSRIDALMSPYRADSDLFRFNARGSSRVSRETALVIRAALEISSNSDGAFDPTLAPLGRRYGFGPLSISPNRPVGRHADISLVDNQLKTMYPGLSLDLCGIAKGYALDEIVRALDGLDFLVELGGEVAARGRHPLGRAWRVGIERPGMASVQRIVEAGRRVFATSGVEAQGYNVGHRRYAHVVDPYTRSPANNGIAAVSVLAESGLIADGLATAAMVLGPAASRPLLLSFDASALFLMQGRSELAEVDVNSFIARGGS